MIHSIFSYCTYLGKLTEDAVLNPHFLLKYKLG